MSGDDTGPGHPGVGSGDEWVELDMSAPIWERFFMPAPLVLVGTREGEGHDLAPKHMAFPLGWENYFAFVCTPAHATYHNARDAGGFTVSVPRPSQLVLTSVAAQPRDEDGEVPGLELLPVEPARVVDGVVLAGAYVQMECELDRVIDGFGENSLIVGRVVAARVHPDAVRTSDESDTELVRRSPLLAYLHPGRFSEISDSRAYPFPADFRK
jgi:flavin reductase (DIM6/NTAB) family NADH-FMN oxidoreductase RutF